MDAASFGPREHAHGPHLVVPWRRLESLSHDGHAEQRTNKLYINASDRGVGEREEARDEPISRPDAPGGCAGEKKADSSHYTLGPKAVSPRPVHHPTTTLGFTVSAFKASCDADALVGGTVFLGDDRFTSSTPGIW